MRKEKRAGKKLKVSYQVHVAQRGRRLRLLEGVPPEPPPDPKVMVDIQKLELERDKHELKLFMTQFEIAKIQADVILKLANAESEEMGPQLEQYKAQMDSLTKQSIAMMQKKEQQENASKQPGSADQGRIG